MYDDFEYNTLYIGVMLLEVHINFFLEFIVICVSWCARYYVGYVSSYIRISVYVRADSFFTAKLHACLGDLLFLTRYLE